MNLTAQYLRERFRQLNRQYFDNQLPEPRLMVSRSRTMLGQFSCRRRRKALFTTELSALTIRVSEYYEQTGDEIDDTLLHEMIHLRIATSRRRDTSPHGPLFRAEMERLNRQGRHITVSARTARLQVSAANRRRQHLVLALTTKDGQHYLSVVHPSYRNYVERLIARAPTIATHSWHVSTSPFFDDFPQARSLRARKVSAAVYKEMAPSHKPS